MSVRRWILMTLCPCIAMAFVLAPAAGAEQASSSSLAREAGLLSAGSDHMCAVVTGGKLFCWGAGGQGRLGYGNTNTIGDDELPSSAGSVDVGADRTVKAVAAGGVGVRGNTCAILDDQSIRCWGSNDFGQLGLAVPGDVGDDELPANAAPVDLGGAKSKAIAIAEGALHTCAIREGGDVFCWGLGANGRLGYGNVNNIGDDEQPRDVGPVNLGPGRTALAISAGGAHTCVILDTGGVRCWGAASFAQLGYGNADMIGDNETPADVGDVKLGTGRTAVAIAAGEAFNCAILDNGSVRCWGAGNEGQLGYGNPDFIGDTETPDTAGPVNLGPGRTARAIAAGRDSTCAILDNGTVTCWGAADAGKLGYGNTNPLGATPTTTPDTAGPVNLGPGRTARAIAIEDSTTCAVLDDGTVRCWGKGTGGELGSGTKTNIGDDETPDQGPLVALGARVDLGSAKGGAGDPGSSSGNSKGNSAPILSRLSMRHRVFAVSSALTPLASRVLIRTPRGTQFRFTLSERSSVAILIERAVAGRSVGGRCVKATRANRHRARCTLYKRAGALTRSGLAAGRRTVSFSGRLGSRALARGSYRATLTPTDTLGLAGTPRHLSFRVEPRLRPPRDI